MLAGRRLAGDGHRVGHGSGRGIALFRLRGLLSSRRIGGELLRGVVALARRVLAVGFALAGLTTPATAAAAATATASIAFALGATIA